MRNEEFQEEDVWEVFKERKDPDSKLTKKNSFKELPSNLIPKRLPTPTIRMIIPKSNKISTFKEPKIVQHSAPVNIPDWSKIYGETYSKNSCSWLDGDSNNDENDRGFAKCKWQNDEDENEEEEEEEERNNVIPPHEYIARKLARSQISSFSVCEGAGRTLKGRDLSRVRNAVLTKTGFLES